MDMLTDTRHGFRHEMPAGAGPTSIPRWTVNPRPGLDEHREAVPDDLVRALHRLAHALGVSPATLLLAAHARVLSTMVGEAEVVTGYVPARGLGPVPCRLATGPASWEALVADVDRRERDVRRRLDGGGHGVHLSRAHRELVLDRPLFETVLDPWDTPGPLTGNTVLWLSMPQDGSGTRLRVRYRTDAFDAPAAARLAGYHLAALAAMAEDPGAAHARAYLLGPEELRTQLHGLAGPERDLPDLRVHEFLERRAAATPDAVAAVHRGTRVTYRELNARANRLGRALLDRGLGREDVVTVVMERTLDWMVTVLAIWKAGLAYLPLEPHFPPERMVTAITRAESAVVVTERASASALDRTLPGLPGVSKLLVEHLAAEDHPEEDLGLHVGPGHLAYVLFTSGSTGQPKGVMCEHAGMLNHILAKIEDLGVREGEVIPQTGPQCFDISVWQLVAALLVGGQTLIVDQDTILDVERLVDTLVEERAGVVQLVPSYLDVLVSYLEQHPRPLPDLHCVCPTGDLLKKELVERWFALYPHIPVVNTYGLTETSDDAVHGIMDRPPAGSQVPLGRPINNTHVDVVDDEGRPVPLGAPGLIVFSGVCVGRGYVNDPERTGAMFGDDPHREGARVCRTGDYGRWRPDGKLDFLGRRDHQVKIRGFRIEIGEIENALSQAPGVRDGAVVVGEGPDGSPFLVAFYSASAPLDAGTIRDHVASRVPAYMVPATYRWQQRLPLTPNGKIDRKALDQAVRDAPPAVGTSAEALTPAERRLAEAWGSVLGLPPERIRRQDSFSGLGGTSLSAVRLAVHLERAVSLQDILRTPVLADQALLLDASAAPATARPTRPAPPLPATPKDS